MSDPHGRLSAYPDGLSAPPLTALRLGATLEQARKWLRCHSTAYGLEGFGALVAGLVIFSPLIDGGTTQLPVFFIRLALLVSGVAWLLGRMSAGEFFLPQTRLDVCVALFGSWAVLSLLWAPYKNASLQWVLSIVSYLALFAMVTHGVRTRTHMWTRVFVLTAMGAGEGV